MRRPLPLVRDKDFSVCTRKSLSERQRARGGGGGGGAFRVPEAAPGKKLKCPVARKEEHTS